MIEISHVSKTHRRDDGTPIVALKDACFEIIAGEFVTIRGASGSGKSSLLNIIGCLDKPTTGAYRLDGEDVSAYSDKRLSRVRSRKIGFVFQSFNLLPRTTARENVEMPMIYAGRRIDRGVALAALERVGLKGRANHYATELSGGEQQRVAIARALINDPPLVLADEPTGNLDSLAAEEVMHILQDLNREGRTVILVTHDDTVAKYAKREISLRDGIVSDMQTRRRTRR
jgi:putative ABC transport system ATP-binding protein